MQNFRANGSAVAEKNGDRHTHIEKYDTGLLHFWLESFDPRLYSDLGGSYHYQGSVSIYLLNSAILHE